MVPGTCKKKILSGGCQILSDGCQIKYFYYLAPSGFNYHGYHKQKKIFIRPDAKFSKLRPVIYFTFILLNINFLCIVGDYNIFYRIY